MTVTASWLSGITIGPWCKANEPGYQACCVRVASADLQQHLTWNAPCMRSLTAIVQNQCLMLDATDAVDANTFDDYYEGQSVGMAKLEMCVSQWFHS